MPETAKKNQRPRRNGNFMECAQKLIRLEVAHTQFAQQIEAKSDQ